MISLHKNASVNFNMLQIFFYNWIFDTFSAQEGYVRDWFCKALEEIGGSCKERLMYFYILLKCFIKKEIFVFGHICKTYVVLFGFFNVQGPLFRKSPSHIKLIVIKISEVGPEHLIIANPTLRTVGFIIVK